MKIEFNDNLVLRPVKDEQEITINESEFYYLVEDFKSYLRYQDLKEHKILNDNQLIKKSKAELISIIRELEYKLRISENEGIEVGGENETCKKKN